MLIGLEQAEVTRIVKGARLAVLQVGPGVRPGEIHRLPGRIGKIPRVRRMHL